MYEGPLETCWSPFGDVLLARNGNVTFGTIRGVLVDDYYEGNVTMSLQPHEFVDLKSELEVPDGFFEDKFKNQNFIDTVLDIIKARKG